MANKDQPLKVEIVGGSLTISIGVSTLCHALKHGPAFESDASGEPEITDEDTFVREVARALERDEEDGTNRIHRMLDAAAEEAIQDGAEGVRFPGDA